MPGARVNGRGQGAERDRPDATEQGGASAIAFAAGSIGPVQVHVGDAAHHAGVHVLGAASIVLGDDGTGACGEAPQIVVVTLAVTAPALSIAQLGLDALGP